MFCGSVIGRSDLLDRIAGRGLGAVHGHDDRRRPRCPPPTVRRVGVLVDAVHVRRRRILGHLHRRAFAAAGRRAGSARGARRAAGGGPIPRRRPWPARAAPFLPLGAFLARASGLRDDRGRMASPAKRPHAQDGDQAASRHARNITSIAPPAFISARALGHGRRLGAARRVAPRSAVRHRLHAGDEHPRSAALAQQ